MGKSTLATSLAVYLHDAGRKVAVLDADDQIHTARALAEAEPKITVAAKFGLNEIPKTIKRLAETHDDIVADSPARLGDETRALMVMSDVAIFPVEPSLKCLHSTKESIEVLEYARTITGGRPKLAWLVLNKAKRHTRIFREVQQLAPTLGVAVAQSIVRDLQAIPEADKQGTVVLRMKAEKSTVSAQSDLVSLFSEVVGVEQKRVSSG